MPARARSKDDSAQQDVFAKLRDILTAHAARFTVTTDTKDRYCLEANVGPATLRAWGGKMKRRQIPVAWVEIGTTSVSFHLMALDSPLRERVSPELARRMQGRTCFHFTSVDEPLVRELESLTAHGLAAFEKAGFVAP